MRKHLLFAYQLATGLSDTTTGLLLIFAPAMTLRLMHLHSAADTLPFLSYIGAFVLSVGIACLYGAFVSRLLLMEKLSVVWLLTGITRALVAILVISQIVAGGLEAGWFTVANTDGILSALQFTGLAKGWLRRVRD